MYMFESERTGFFALGMGVFSWAEHEIETQE
jgi:hypothetical protein